MGGAGAISLSQSLGFRLQMEHTWGSLVALFFFTLPTIEAPLCLGTKLATILNGLRTPYAGTP
jgi:hypothetical protein